MWCVPTRLIDGYALPNEDEPSSPGTQTLTKLGVAVKKLVRQCRSRV
jgi:hypothetical protein